MDNHEVIDALRHLISSLHLDTVAGAAIAGTALAGGLYVARLGIRRRRSAAAVAHERPSPVHINEFDGTETLFVMPDITGYTKLLSAAGRDRAAQVNEAVIMLLDALMQSAKGRLTVAKLEGDAILFFAEGDKLTPNDLGDILLDLFRAFDATRQRLALDGALPSTLSELDLKVVVHCGHAERFTFRNAIDLIGADVILTYRLLKCGLEQRRYILSTSSASRPPTASAARPSRTSDPARSSINELCTSTRRALSPSARMSSRSEYGVPRHRLSARPEPEWAVL